MWHLVQKPKTIRATAENSAQFRDLKSVACDRAIKKPILAYLREQIRSGRARPFDVSLCWCDEDGQLYRVNGKHGSIAAAEYLSDPLVFNKHDLHFLHTEYRADTLKDVSLLYSTFDRKTQGRSAQDVYMAFASCDEELATLPSHIISLATSAIDFSDNNGSSGSFNTPEDRANRLLDEKAFATFLHKMATEGEGSFKPLDRTPCAAAIFRTYKKSHADACKFWELVKSERGQDRNCPSRVLARFLSSVTILRSDKAKKKGGKTKGDEKEKQGCGRLAMLVKCIHGWNAWRCGEATQLKYYADKPIPAAV